ncbi:hypothetical protein [Actinoplanes siamensis]|uniref:Uncharacterized protein n=1 Tax=Actinoplanes siamensis TaxID=1223317 RepID=A0A919N740_9ACTN|nr:hypothetical protein [Actinoplanes siamensis]GIF05555.1 hypothetical protein Asi03nite_30930 [Actinoplanes siamensis]
MVKKIRVATVFATDSDRYSGQGVVVITPVGKLRDVVKPRGLIPQEAEVGLKMTAADFERRSTIIIPLKRSREILKGMGIRVPIRVSTSDPSTDLLDLPKLSCEQIEQFVREAGNG